MSYHKGKYYPYKRLDEEPHAQAERSAYIRRIASRLAELPFPK